MHRFFIPPDLFHTPEIILPKDVSQQISRVLRLKVGSEVLLLDGQGFEYKAQLCQISDTQCTVQTSSKNAARGEPLTNLTLIIGLTQREKFELILQKCTEIGVSQIIPVVTSRTLIQKPEDVVDKFPRWRKIMQKAAEQSRRGVIPTLAPPIRYSDSLMQAQSNPSLKLVLWEEEMDLSIKLQLKSFTGTHVMLIVGPEGGLSQDEVDAARQMGFTPVSLGKRILRMETAAILAAGLVIYEMG